MIEIGQKVVCINNKPKPNSDAVTIQYLAYLEEGATYTVRGIHDHPSGVIAIVLDEIKTPFSDRLGRELGYMINRFVPLDSHQWADEMLDKISQEIEEEFFVGIS